MALKSKKIAKPVKSKDVPATYGALNIFRNELKSDISSARLDIKSFEKKLVNQFSGLEMRVFESSEKVHIVKGKVELVDSKVVSLRENMHERFDDLGKRLAGLTSDVNSRFETADAKLSNLTSDMSSRFEAVDKKLLSMSTQIDQLKSVLDQTNSKIDRVLALVEEQNARNRYVLDGYSTMYESHKSLESRVNKLETGT